MDEQRQDDQLEPIYKSSVPIKDIAMNTSRERWTREMSGERGSARSELAARMMMRRKTRNHIYIFTQPLRSGRI